MIDLLKKLQEKYLGYVLIVASKYLGSVIRHTLSALAGSLVAIGALEAGESANFIALNTEVISGILVYAFAQSLSFLEKKGK